MSECDRTCRPCVYHGWVGSQITCDYILMEGRRRGCPAGEGCDKRETGKVKRMSIDARTFRLAPGAGLPPPMIAATAIMPKREVASRVLGSAAAAGTADSRREDHPPQPAEGAGNRSKMRKKPAEETPEERERRLAKERERYARNKEKIHAQEKARRDRRTPEQKARKKEYMRKWLEANRERMNAYQRERRSKETPEQKQRRREVAKQWVNENREKVNAAKRAYRSRKKAEEAHDG